MPGQQKKWFLIYGYAFFFIVCWNFGWSINYLFLVLANFADRKVLSYLWFFLHILEIEKVVGEWENFWNNSLGIEKVVGE